MIRNMMKELHLQFEMHVDLCGHRKLIAMSKKQASFRKVPDSPTLFQASEHQWINCYDSLGLAQASII